MICRATSFGGHGEVDADAVDAPRPGDAKTMRKPRRDPVERTRANRIVFAYRVISTTGDGKSRLGIAYFTIA